MKFKIIFIVSIFFIGFNSCSEDDRKGGGISKGTNLSPEKTVFEFIKDLGLQNYKSAYSVTNNPLWGTYEEFSSPDRFGAINLTEIKKIETKNENNIEAVIYAEAFYSDPVNGNNIFFEKFYLKKEKDIWKIIKLKVLKKVENFTSENIEEEIKNFIPFGYSMLDYSAGDINNDNIEDVILIIKSNNNLCTSQKTVILLTRNKNKKLVKTRANNFVCYRGSDINLKPTYGITIKDVYFTVENSTDDWKKFITFKYNSSKKEWYLQNILEEINKLKQKSKTKKDFGEIKFTDFDYENFL